MQTKEQVAGAALLEASTKVKSSTDGVETLLKQKSQSASLIEDVALKVEAALLPIIQECESRSLPPEDAFARLLKATKNIVSQLKLSSKKLSGEVEHLKGYSEGVIAAAKMIESIGSSILREDERVRELATSNIDLEQKRQAGERPESLRVKRKVSALREDSDESHKEKS